MARARRRSDPAITSLSVAGYKSISDELTIQLRPLTILAGGNSSGKSSIVQPLLLLKQTLEATYDPGPLRLDGPNVRFTGAQQLFHRVSKSETLDEFHVKLGFNGTTLGTYFALNRESRLEVARTVYHADHGLQFDLTPDTPERELRRLIPRESRSVYQSLLKAIGSDGWEVGRDRCFLEIRPSGITAEDSREAWVPSIAPYAAVSGAIRETIHIPGLRGNPLRTYPVSAVGGEFPGTFERYAAGLISHWQDEKNTDKLRGLTADLVQLGLTWKVRAQPVSDTEVEIQVGRLPRSAQGGAWDLVSIADVGFGVSQTLPVLVALRIARANQLVYLEQPEIHLHPRAQYGLAHVIVDAVSRGVRVIVETHSSTLLLAIQTCVATRGLRPRDLILHWFTRTQQGDTEVATAEVDQAGSFGDWPEDFGDVLLGAESKYLDAASTVRSR
jgi:predicted ATPase